MLYQKNPIVEELLKVEFIFDCLKSCETPEQFDNAVRMLDRYENQMPKIPELLVMIINVRDFIEMRGFALLLKFGYNHNKIKRYDSISYNIQRRENRIY